MGSRHRSRTLPSPDFKGQDINGKTLSLKDFNGKYLYIDVWATWCGPCKKEIPFLKELEKKFEGKNITFLSLSTDQNKTDWENMVKSGEALRHPTSNRARQSIPERL